MNLVLTIGDIVVTLFVGLVITGFLIAVVAGLYSFIVSYIIKKK